MDSALIIAIIEERRDTLRDSASIRNGIRSACGIGGSSRVGEGRGIRFAAG